MQILETKEVKKYYQTPSGIVRALDGVSLSVTEGTFGAIVGSSGSGKTTLLHMLGGFSTARGADRRRSMGAGNLTEGNVRGRKDGFSKKKYRICFPEL